MKPSRMLAVAGLASMVALSGAKAEVVSLDDAQLDQVYGGSEAAVRLLGAYTLFSASFISASCARPGTCARAGIEVMRGTFELLSLLGRGVPN